MTLKMGQMSIGKAIPIVQNQLPEYAMGVCACVSAVLGVLCLESWLPG